MDGNKLEISGRVTADPPAATYKPISESDAEESAQKRPTSLLKSNSNTEMDGADDPMLPKDEKKNVVLDAKVDVGDVKFTSNNEKQNGEAKLDIGEIKSAFVGMTKEELMKYANDPFWVRLRWFLFIAFWLLWLGMLLGAIAIIIAAPKCAPPAPRTWWEQGPLTEVEHDTPKDDLERLSKQKIKAVIVAKPGDSYQPANESSEILTFLERVQDLDLNVIVELEPITTTLWLEKSAKNEEQYGDYYIWAKGKNNDTGNPTPPNNWLSPKDSSPAWQYSDARTQFYYAPNGAAHLNFRNPQVVEEFADILRQWLDAGAKGIRLKGVPYLLVDPKLENEAFSSQPGYVHTDYQFYSHARTLNVEGIADVLTQWKSVLREHKENNGPIMVAEDLNSLDAYIVNDTLSFDLPQHSKLFSSPEKLSTASSIHESLNSAFTVLGDYWPLWKYDASLSTLTSDVLNMLTMLLPGSPLVQQNTEIDPNLLQIRGVPSVMFGSCHRDVLANDTVFAYLRVATGNPGYLVACNPSEKLVNVDFTSMKNVSDEVTIQLLSQNYQKENITDMELGLKIPAKDVIMPAKSAIILTYVPKSD